VEGEAKGVMMIACGGYFVLRVGVDILSKRDDSRIPDSTAS